MLNQAEGSQNLSACNLTGLGINSVILLYAEHHLDSCSCPNLGHAVGLLYTSYFLAATTTFPVQSLSGTPDSECQQNRPCVHNPVCRDWSCKHISCTKLYSIRTVWYQEPFPFPAKKHHKSAVQGREKAHKICLKKRLKYQFLKYHRLYVGLSMLFMVSYAWFGSRAVKVSQG